MAEVNDARRRSLVEGFAGAGCDVLEVGHLDEAEPHVARLRPRLVILAFAGRDNREALAVIARLRRQDSRLLVLVVVDEGSERLAIDALRLGVRDYFTGPASWPAIAASVRRCLNEDNDRRLEVRQSARSGSAPALVFRSGSMRRVAEYLDLVARQESTVLITGETGTGKELAAALIHQRSRRRGGRFVSGNCAAIPEGLLETELFGHESGAFTGAAGRREGLLAAADGGTMLLDEVGELAPLAQAKILRALETREACRVGGTRPVRFDVRIVAATNQDLERAVEEGRFRKDLYYRLNVARVHIPPLRERRSDIGALLDHYLHELGQQGLGAVEGFADETRAALEAYDWPGNVRELRNLVEAILVAPPSHPITIADLPAPLRARLQKVATGPQEERRRLLDALLAANWNKSQAAASLNWSRMTIYRKMARYSIVRSHDPGVRRSS